MNNLINNNKKLLITVVKKGLGTDIVEASKEAGCEGGTILPGKGTGLKEKSSFWGLTFDPEKEVIFSVVDESDSQRILNAICKIGKLDEPGNGISFIVNINSIAGIAHLLNEN